MPDLPPELPASPTEPGRRRLLMISHPFPPRLQPGAFRTLRFLRYLPEFGWDPLVLTMRPGHGPPACPIDEGLLELVPPGIHVEQAPVWHPYYRTVSMLKRLFGGARPIPPSSHGLASSPTESSAWKQHYAFVRDLILKNPDSEMGWVIPAVMRGLKIIRKHKPAAMMVTSPPHSAQLVGAILKLLTRVPLVMDFRDPWARSPWDGDGKSLRRSINQQIESFCVRRADQILLNTDPLREEFQAYYGDVPPARFHTVMNGYDPAMKIMIDDLLKSTPPRPSATDANQPWLLIHAGQLYGRRNPGVLFAAMRELSEEGHAIRFENYGIVEDKMQMHSLVQGHRVESLVHFFPSLPHREMLAKIAQGDAILILQQDTLVQIPSKVFESLLFNKPLLGLTGPGATRTLFMDYQLGAVAAPHSVEEIKSAIRQLMQSSDTIHARRRHQEAMEDFHARTLTQQLHNILLNTSCGSADETHEPSYASSVVDANQLTGLS